jgi:hypothetical protein
MTDKKGEGMEITDVKARKVAVEKQIASALKDLEKETDCLVAEVHVVRSGMVRGFNEPEIDTCKIELCVS